MFGDITIEVRGKRGQNLKGQDELETDLYFYFSSEKKSRARRIQVVLRTPKS